jgi:hypothetical protein
LGNDGIDAAKALWIDYGTSRLRRLPILAVWATRDLAEARGWRRLAAFGPPVMFFAAAGAVFDAIEDVGLLLAVDRHGGDLAPRVAQVCASLKFGLLAVTIVYLLVGLLLRFRTRSA